MKNRQNAKGSKEGKNRNPNKPQKPVYVCALFFHDTKAAIKGQNPLDTFGEFSKIVASMCDSGSFYRERLAAYKDKQGYQPL